MADSKPKHAKKSSNPGSAANASTADAAQVGSRDATASVACADGKAAAAIKAAASTNAVDSSEDDTESAPQQITVDTGVVEIDFECLPFYHYSLANMIPTPARSLTIHNGTNADLPNVTATIDSSTDLLADSDFTIGAIPAGETIEVDCSRVRVDTNRLVQLTEQINDQLTLRISVDGEAVFEDVTSIDFYTFDQWTGIPETLASFMTPNHPDIACVIVKAAKHLGEWTGSSAFDGYQSGDPRRARLQAAAIFRAIQEFGIVYVGAPASFSRAQRIRMPDAVLSQRMATCLDFSILYCTCLEAVDLRPLLILIRGHAFIGVWLDETSFPDVLVTDSSAIAKRCAKGVDQMTVVQSTDMAQSSGHDFETAERTGRMLLDPGIFDVAVDVHTARLNGFYPLPLRVMGENGWRVEEAHEQLGRAEAPAKHETSRAFIDVAEENRSKTQVWERSLLDLSMRNNLLNMRMGTRVMPILTPSIDAMEDVLAGGNDLIIAPRPSALPAVSDKDAFTVMGVGGKEVQGLLSGELKEGRLRTMFSDAALKRNLNTMYRSARSSLEETGANTLFLALGTLQWVDEKRGDQVRFAPLMLFPIEISRTSARANYTIRLRDEDPQINISLLEMLRVDYGIEINGLDPLPTDDAGVDTRLVLNTFANKIMDQPGWQVAEAASIGLFSFSQFVMWNDIHQHADKLRASKIVNSMIEGHLTWTPEHFDPTEKVDPSELLLPVEADASQLFAIKEAVEGESFVLHGPPGTGKSQTITAIIANALVRGQKVLFVAEKMAALEVVERRLNDLGLAPYCLEVHSHKATKNYVLDQVKEATTVSRSGSSEDYARKANEVRALRENLDMYAQGLQRENAAGISLRDQICTYERLHATSSPMEVPASFVAGVTSPEDFTTKMNAAERLIALAKPLAPTSSHPLAGLDVRHYTQELSREIPQLMDAFETSLTAFEQAEGAFAAALGAPAPRLRDDCMRLSEQACALADAPSLPATWLQAASIADVVWLVRTACTQHKALSSRYADILTRRRPTFLKLDPASLRGEWVEAKGKGFLSRNKAINQVLAKVSLSSIVPVDENGFEQAIAELEDYRQLRDAAATAEQNAQAYLSPFRRVDGSLDWDALEQTASQAEAAANSGTITDDIRKFAGNQAVLQAAVTCREALHDFAGKHVALARAVGQPNIAPDDDWFAAQRSVCERAKANLGRLREWAIWSEAAERARTYGMGVLVDWLAKNPVDSGLRDRFVCGVYRAMCQTSLDDTPGMNEFSSVRFDQTVRQYRRADEELRALARREIGYRVAALSPDLVRTAATNPQVGKLQRALRSRGRNVSIRSVLSETGDLVRELCPCFLMSPLSVAQYLEPGKQQFDLLIFDEASQLQTCKAVGALSRAKNAVVVGDPRQMPPTSFFQGKGADEDYEDVADLESVLEDCLALNMPQAYLRCHYRSKHESLIAFSNRRFYESKMLTFPSADDRDSRVRLVAVNGVFDRGGSRTNRAEAEAIVAELGRRAHDPQLSARSVGVVTFNVSQQELIEDLLQEACEHDAALDSWAHSGSEPVFVKNLENVQGDERDAILFSITYGRDAKGRMTMNFGPINREGGWRRLNVAVTRAREEMLVFASIDPSDINLNRATSRGPASLQAFLAYAQHGTPPVQKTAMQTDTAGDEIASELVTRLEAAGYVVERNVGRSTFHVDIAVVDPYRRDRYMAAILLDGPAYRQARTTRDREIAQPSMLSRLGWNVYRVWALDWWEDPDAATSKVFDFLAKAKAAAKEEAARLGAEAEAKQVETTAAPAPSVTAGSDSALETSQAKTTASSAQPAETAAAPKHAMMAEPAPATEAASELAPQPAPERTAGPTASSHHEHTPEPAPDSLSTSKPAHAAVHAPSSMEESMPLAAASAASPGVASAAVPSAGASPTPAIAPRPEPTLERKQAAAPSPAPAPADRQADSKKSASSTPRASHRTMYQLADIDAPQVSDFADIDDAQLVELVERVVAVEAPIVSTLLVKRVAQACGMARVGSKIKARCEKAIKSARCTSVKQAGQTVVWAKNQEPRAYLIYRVAPTDDSRRDITEFPLEEIVAASLDVLAGSQPLEDEELARAISSSLGFKRVSSNMIVYLKKGLTLGVRRGLLAHEGKTYRLNDDAPDEPVAPAISAAETAVKTETTAPASTADPALEQDKKMLRGFIASFMQDGQIGLDEAATLKLRMMTHGSLKSDPTCQRIYQLLSDVLADGTIDDSEQQELIELFAEVAAQ